MTCECSARHKHVTTSSRRQNNLKVQPTINNKLDIRALFLFPATSCHVLPASCSFLSLARVLFTCERYKLFSTFFRAAVKCIGRIQPHNAYFLPSLVLFYRPACAAHHAQDARSIGECATPATRNTPKLESMFLYKLRIAV